MAKRQSTRRWVRGIKTDSTAPPPGTFTGSAEQIARTMARKNVSPKGLGSGIRMIQYFINRAGRGLSASRRRTLERAKQILRQRCTMHKCETPMVRNHRFVHCALCICCFLVYGTVRRPEIAPTMNSTIAITSSA